jgi:outer membrane receptor protein involved in Fe transport
MASSRSFVRRRGLQAVLLASTMLAGVQGAVAQQQADAANTGLEEVVVTAEKRSENLQNVPISVQALGEAKLEQMSVQNFEDYSKLLPSISYQSTNPGQTNIYMRGIASGGDGNHSGPEPTVGVYVDEIPTTTILGQIDFHIYDVARIEALSGPQGTLYGASSESGTLKIVTNQPDPHGFSAGYNVEGNYTDHGSWGDVVEGFINEPIGDNAAIRIVGYEEHDSGYINNVYGTRTYPSFDYTVNNAGRVKSDYNDVQTYGGRMALKINLDDNWTLTPAIMGQDQSINGINAYDTTIGPLAVRHFFPETDHDRWYLPSLTVTGKIGNFDVTYAGGYFEHDINTQADYSDYSYFYDVCCGYGKYETGPGGKPIDIGQYIVGVDHFEKISQELRVASPREDRFRILAGLFYESQLHDIEQDYKITGLDPALQVTGWPETWWLTKEERIDRDYAAFGTASYDISSEFTLDAGLRVYRYDNTLQGFYGFGPSGTFSSTGQLHCFSNTPFQGAPCEDLNKQATENNVIYKVTLTWKVDPDKLLYVTASDGYRPGGANRNGSFAPYQSDFLYNYELGWKTTWMDHRIRWNGDVFYDPWDSFQFSFLGANGLPDIVNAGQAVSQGIETDLSVKVDQHLTLSGNASLIDAHLTAPYCGTVDASGNPVTSCSAATAQAPNGTQLPVTPYLKGNLTARWDFEVADDSDAYFQAAVMYTGGSWSDLRQNLDGIDPREVLGRQPSYVEADFAAGYNWGNSSLDLYIKNAFDSRGQVTRYAECTPTVCGSEVYVVPIHPMEIGLKFGQKF